MAFSLVSLLRRFLPPYHQNLVYVICGAHILYGSIALAVHQTFWVLSTRIFPTAFDMFDDTRNRVMDYDTMWNWTSRQQLDRYQNRLTISWVVATFDIFMAILCIIPQFCKVEVGEGNRVQELDLCIRRPVIAKLMAPLLLMANLLLAACMGAERWYCPAEDRLFHSLFDGAIKEEVFLTNFESELECVSDEDKEGTDVWKCDGIMERSILNERWLDPMIVAHAAIVIFSLFGCLCFNWQDRIFKQYDEVDVEENNEDEDAKNKRGNDV
ncbi:hypothetical protein niasHT_000995 [Heterodera trifolii]|uniref:Uncharacterized protein n=1 Tax=Heterodera trifolii TaxID=157864 RepID=A0ABD2LSR3_9BILA